VPGSGKSFAAKRELLNVFLATDDKILMVDPIEEYAPLTKRLGGQVIEISPDSPHHINPMDIKLTNNNSDENPLALAGVSFTSNLSFNYRVAVSFCLFPTKNKTCYFRRNFRFDAF